MAFAAVNFVLIVALFAVIYSWSAHWQYETALTNAQNGTHGMKMGMNQTPIDWDTKKQSTVETATFGSEFVAARTATEQIIDLRNTLRYLGVPIRQHSYLFGDNQTAVNSATQPHGKLHKRHTMLSFHRVREAIASKMSVFTHIAGNMNPADILSKHWSKPQVWPMLRVLLFYFGDTYDTLKDTPTTKETQET